MASEYMTQIENSNLERRLLRTDNIPVLEELLNRDSQILEKLQKLKEDNKLDMGNKITTKELKELFPKICTEVDDFLGIQSKDTTKVEYSSLFKLGIESTSCLLLYALSAISLIEPGNLLLTNQGLNLSNVLEGIIGGLIFLEATVLHSTSGPHYDPLFKKVVLSKTTRTELIPTISHEHTHHLQFSRGLKGYKYLIFNKYSIFQEGHARGVERHLSEDYRERENNEAFLYDILDTTVGEFKSAYVWMCKKLDKPVRKSLLKTKTTRDGDENSERFMQRKPTPHARGNALFSIYEALHGKQIYNHMIHGNFKFS